MSTTTTLQPPPTFNTLDPFQRARLIRSTRKLGKVLGTTPILLEPTETCDFRELLPIGPKSYPSSRSNSPVPSRSAAFKQSRRQGSLFNIPLGSNPNFNNLSTTSLASQLSTSSTSSTTALRETKGFSSRRTRRADTPPPLILQVNTVPVAPSDPRLPPSNAASSSKNQVSRPPLSASTNVAPLQRSRSSSGASSIAAIPTPLTPSFRFQAPTMPEMRRKKMAKLTEKLGENVPPELVFSSYPEVPKVPVAPVVAPRMQPLPPLPQPVATTETLPIRASSLDAVRSPDETPKEARQRRRRSMSVGHIPIAIQLPSSTGNKRWEAPSEWRLGPVPKDVKKNKKEEDDEEALEWNAEQFGDMLKQLRALRSRR